MLNSQTSQKTLDDYVSNSDVRFSNDLNDFMLRLAEAQSPVMDYTTAAVLADVAMRRLAAQPADPRRCQLIRAFEGMVGRILADIDAPPFIPAKPTSQITALLNFTARTQDVAKTCFADAPLHSKCPPDFRRALSLIDSAHILTELKAEGFEDRSADDKSWDMSEKLLGFVDCGMNLTARGLLADRLLHRIQADHAPTPSKLKTQFAPEQRLKIDASDETKRRQLRRGFVKVLVEIAETAKTVASLSPTEQMAIREQITAVYSNLHDRGDTIISVATDDPLADAGDLTPPELFILTAIDYLGRNIGSERPPLATRSFEQFLARTQLAKQ